MDDRSFVALLEPRLDRRNPRCVMKIATFRVGGERRVGLVDERRQSVAPFDVPVAEALLGVLALIDRPASPGLLSSMPLSEAVLDAPIPRPRRNIFCVGKNYREHAREFAGSGFDSSAVSGAVPKHPIIFSKVPDCVIAHRDPVRIDRSVSGAIDYEADTGRAPLHLIPRSGFDAYTIGLQNAGIPDRDFHRRDDRLTSAPAVRCAQRD